VSRPSWTKSLTAPVFGWRDIGVWDIGFGLVLSVFGILSVTGATGSTNHGGVGASLAVLTMTAPVVVARRQPVLTAALLAAGAGLNWALFDHMVRCGAGLPAVFYVAFVIGSRCPAWRDTGFGLALLGANLVFQAYADPNLDGPGVLVLMVPITVGFMISGRILQSRNVAAERLRARTAELREQRERNARLAVAADQARIANDLDSFLHQQVGQMAAAAEAGKAALAVEPGEAQDAFIAIQNTGRETLTHMRDVVANLRDQASTDPQPVLAQLDRLLGDAARANARLEVTGDPRLLPPGLELSGYRIVEHLLTTLEDGSTAPVDVRLSFGADQLQLTVSGPTARRGDIGPALAAAKERAALYGGSLRTSASAGRRETVVLLPLAVGHV
jgi:signal transduction histidine kinase